jgi:anaphase-promoting complex subunit 1
LIYVGIDSRGKENILHYSTDDWNIDRETVAQVYCNIVAGACLAIGIKYASSADISILEVLVGLVNAILSYCLHILQKHYVKLLLPCSNERLAKYHLHHYAGSSFYSNLISRLFVFIGTYTTRTCLNTCVLAIGALMAGSGNLDVVRIVRYD